MIRFTSDEHRRSPATEEKEPADTRRRTAGGWLAVGAIVLAACDTSACGWEYGGSSVEDQFLSAAPCTYMTGTTAS